MKGPIASGVAMLSHYDLSFSSYFVFGMQEFCRRRSLAFEIRSHEEPHEFEDLVRSSSPDLLRRAVFVAYPLAGRVRLAALDLMDSADPRCPGSPMAALIPWVDLYFRANLDRNKLYRDSFLSGHAHKVFDLPFFFGVRPHKQWHLVRCGRQSTVGCLLQIARTYYILTPLSHMLALSGSRKRLDFAFLVSYYDDPDLQADNEARYELIAKLNEDRRFRGVAGMAFSRRASKAIPGQYSKYAIEFLSLHKLLRMYAESRLAVYVRGVHDCLSFKLGQYLALGLPIVGQPILRENAFALGIPNFSSQFAFESPKQIIEGIAEYLSRPAGDLRSLGRSNREYFMERIQPEKTAEYVLSAFGAVP